MVLQPKPPLFKSTRILIYDVLVFRESCMLSHSAVLYIPRHRFPVLYGTQKCSKGYNLEHEDASSILSALLKLKMEWPVGSRPTGALLFYFSV